MWLGDEVRVIPNCRCSHACWRHVFERDRCKAPGCGCLHYREQAPAPSPAEQAVIDRFGIFAEEQQ